MAACGRLQHIFDSNLLPENQTLLETLSWNQNKPLKSLEQPSSLTEIFGELHFSESTPLSSSTEENNTNHNSRHKSSGSFSSLSSESLQICTEGLGSESSDEVEDMKSGCCWQSGDHHEGVKKHIVASSRVGGGGYPPPISCIGRTGKPWVWFKSFRGNGRFILKEVRIPSHEFLHACREDGRLKLHLVQPDDDDDDDDLLEEEYDDDEEEEEEDVGVTDGEEENVNEEK